MATRASDPAAQFATAVAAWTVAALFIGLGIWLIRSLVRNKPFVIMRQGPHGLELSIGVPTAANPSFLIPSGAHVHMEIVPCGIRYRSVSKVYGLRITHPEGSKLFAVRQGAGAINAGVLLAELRKTGSPVDADARVLKYASIPAT